MSLSCCCFTQISTSEVGVIERFGKYSRFAEAGCNPLLCPCEYLAGIVSLKVQELKVELETKTKDNVFVTIHISVQYVAVRDKVYQAYYSLTDLNQQMKSYVFDVVRASLCNLTLDQSFEAKDEISHEVKKHLAEVMDTYGYTILNALVTDLTPDDRVRNAMNEINASKRLKEAAYQRAEGEKVVKVKNAEALSESMYLQGVGVSKQRQAIMNGLQESIVDFSKIVQGTSAKEIMDLLVLTQYFDTLQEMGQHSRMIFLASDDNSSSGAIRQAFLEAEAAKK